MAQRVQLGCEGLEQENCQSINEADNQEDTFKRKEIVHRAIQSSHSKQRVHKAIWQRHGAVRTGEFQQ